MAFGFNEDKSKTVIDRHTENISYLPIFDPYSNAVNYNGEVPPQVINGQNISVSIYATKSSDTKKSQLVNVPFKIFEDGINGSGEFKDGMDVGFAGAYIKGSTYSGKKYVSLYFPNKDVIQTTPLWIFEYTG